MTEVTRVPRWSAHPGEGSGTVTAALPDRPEALAAKLGAPIDTVVFAAFARVVAALVVEDSVRVGLQTTDSTGVRPVEVSMAAPTWRVLVAAAGDAAGRAGEASEGCDAVFGADGGAPLAVRRDGDRLVVRHSLRDFDAEHAERIAGYLVRALAVMSADPDAEHAEADLLSAAERRHQLEERNGPVRELPDARFHEIFAERAKEHPDRVAAVCRAEEWTYDRLDRAANRIAHALLADGLRPEGVVAVATERGLPWLASILGVFKAGGVYLPVEPDWPAVRVAGLIEQSGARHVLTEPGGHPARELRPEVSWHVPAELLDDERHPDGSPGVAVGPDAAAYIYFTSGSTGLPKGATCEHLGMLNHLYAKLDDLRVGPEDVIVQSTQASFDISLWQLIAGFLVGAKTVIVPKADALDVPRFMDIVVECGATVAQVVPSYLDLMLDHETARPHGLGRLREVSVTGEAITRPLIARWFERFPGVRLINAYGATEVSDDATHEIMSEPPPDDTVPVGRPLANVLVSVLGPGDRLVPLGSPGEIVFSGICVGRGYINDAERTAAAFLPDPHRPGVRMYRTGDFGRWLPDGKLGFHGRRDEQVKIHGIRIELGEVESRLLEHPEVRGGSVVAVPVPGAGKELVAFYTSNGTLTAEALRAHLAGSLPAGYVPSRIYEVAALPLTPNGKVDKKSLIRRAADELPRLVAAVDRPATPVERRIAEGWAEILDLPVDRIGRGDRFFALGASSLAALRLVALLDGLLALGDVLADPPLAELAAAVTDRPDPAS